MMPQIAPQSEKTADLRSVHTSNLPELFDQLGISLIVSTYQAGKAIVVRNDNGTLNTHFRTFSKPMGIVADQTRLTIGGANTVWEYRNMPALAKKLEPAGKHDACYLPRRIHVTGDIDIHELARDSNNELWVVNTRFCCLCTLDAEHSFYPRWRPPFVSALAPEDRCHLEWHRHGRWPSQVRHRAGRNRHARRLAREQGQGRHPDGHREQRNPAPWAFHAALAALVSGKALAA